MRQTASPQFRSSATASENPSSGWRTNVSCRENPVRMLGTTLRAFQLFIAFIDLSVKLKLVSSLFALVLINGHQILAQPASHYSTDRHRGHFSSNWETPGRMGT